MKIFISGVAGFIGFHLSNSLLGKDTEILGVDNLNSYYDTKLKKRRLENLLFKDNFKFLQVDLLNQDNLKSCFADFNPDIVINLAAQAGVRYSLINPSSYLDSNILSFLHILNLSEVFEVERFIYASSSSVYGDEKKIPFSENFENLNPSSLYGKTKLANEIIAHNNKNLKTIGLRFFTVFGPWGRPDMAYYSFTKNIKEENKIKVFNQGSMKRDMTYITDIVDGIESSIFFKTENQSEIFNLGNNSPIETMQLINTIENFYQKKAIIEYANSNDEVDITFADLQKSKKCLNYEPKVSFDEGIINFFNWYDSYS
tara:strand:- start:1154 stop:2095 length:942 start_codon:yes stop_codon:yes gene_type:complete